MRFIREGSVMENLFEIRFPLVLKYDESLSITFTLEKGTSLSFGRGLYYLQGDNGAGKTSFLNMLALTAGCVGKAAENGSNPITFKNIAYGEDGFDYHKAADVREAFFCIFPQKAFFLPVSTRDNYILLNGSKSHPAETFPADEFPDLLSGGQQQKRLMDIILDSDKPVWFLDEPLANLDAERCFYFWKLLDSAFGEGLETIFFTDHRMAAEIEQEMGFDHCNTLRARMERRGENASEDVPFSGIDVFVNPAPKEFFAKQMKKSEHIVYFDNGHNPLPPAKDRGTGVNGSANGTKL
jgi:ABC-type Mn2+/Zn2+ transport system ATPase subunit